MIISEYYVWEKAMLVCSNKIKFSLIFIIIIFLIGCSNLVENRKFNRIMKNFLNQYFFFCPVQATLMGNREYNSQVNNFSKENMDKLIRFIKATTEKIGSIDTSKLSYANKINYQVLFFQLKLHLFELEKWKRWQKDPALYTRMIYDAVYGLKFQTTDTTVNVTRNLISRLDQIPNLLIQAKKNLQPEYVTNLDAAIEQIEDQRSMIAFQLSNKFMITDALFDSLNKQSEIVADSLESFRIFLELKSKTSTKIILSMNPEMYQSYINLVCQKEIALDELINLIENDYQKYYAQILNIANAFFNNRNKLNQFPRDTNLIEKLKDEIEKQSLGNKEEIISFCYESIDNTRRFIDEIWNLSLPIDYNMLIDWAENDKLFGLKLATFKHPGLLEPVLKFYCVLGSVTNDGDWIQQLSRLRDYNKPKLKLIMMLEAIPVHYQIWLRNLNKIPILARAFPDRVFLNAWRYYFAFSLLDAGFEGYNPELRYMLLKDYLRNLLLAKIEIQYYLQKLSIPQLERLLLESNLFKKNETDEVIKQINSLPGQALTIYWGVYQLKDLEQTCRKEIGPYFNIKNFFQNILEPGPIPIELIHNKVVKKLQSNRITN